MSRAGRRVQGGGIGGPMEEEYEALALRKKGAELRRNMRHWHWLGGRQELVRNSEEEGGGSEESGNQG